MPANVRSHRFQFHLNSIFLMTAVVALIAATWKPLLTETTAFLGSCSNLSLPLGPMLFLVFSHLGIALVGCFVFVLMLRN